MMRGPKVIRTESPTAIVVHDSDPDFQIRFHYLIEQILGLDYGEYLPIVVVGGGFVLDESANQEQGLIHVGEQIKSSLEEFKSIETIVLVGHEDCKRVRLTEKQAKASLREAGKSISYLLGGGIEIKLYFVGFEVTEEVSSSEHQLAP